MMNQASRATLPCFWCLLLALLMSSSEAITREPNGVRAATKEDLIGFWEQVDVRGHDGEDLSGLYYSGDQFWEFFEDGYLRTLVFNGEAPAVEAMLPIRQRGQKYTRWYFVEDVPGMVQISYPNGSTFYVMVTYYEVGLMVPRTAPRGQDLPPLPQAGDLTVTYVDLETERPTYFRLLRRLGDVVEPLPPEELPQEPVPATDDPVMQAIERELEELPDLRYLTEPQTP